MLPHKIQLEIVTPERRVVSREVDEVILPGEVGSFGVLPGHAPLLAAHAPGVARVRGGGRDDVMAISSGYAEVLPDRVIVLAQTCERAEEIDTERARTAVSRYERMLRENPESDPDVIRFKLSKHLARLSASQTNP
ncbi:MAG: F0F1 ATP synthase subunit epsilon [Acidobacteriota bacterium]|nr:MAG: F0F1 ATP synthase subunit epsilon [Acidobacteriota bacterium]